MLKTMMLILSLFLSASAYAVDGNQLLAQVDRNLAPSSYEMYRKLINIEPDGRKKEFVLFTVPISRKEIWTTRFSPSPICRTWNRFGKIEWGTL